MTSIGLFSGTQERQERREPGMRPDAPEAGPIDESFSQAFWELTRLRWENIMLKQALRHLSR